MTCERILILTGPRPDAEGTPEQRRLHTLAEAVSGATSWEDWLSGRRYHYGIVATADSRWSEGTLNEAISASQPQAVRIALAGEVDLGAIASALGRPDPGISA